MKSLKTNIQQTNEIASDIQENAFDYSIRSPLRYPGGKTRGVEFITQFFPKSLDKLISPFFGGGSIELSVAAKGTLIFGYDIFSPLVEFWQCLLTQPNELADAVEKYYPLSKQNFYKLQQMQTQFKTKLERAAVYYVLNRSSFSGATFFTNLFLLYFNKVKGIVTTNSKQAAATQYQIKFFLRGC